MRLSALLCLAPCLRLVTAATPPGFQPADSHDLVVAFGQTLIVNGTNIPRNHTANPPTVGTAAQLPAGPYTLMIVDLDIPPTPPGTPNATAQPNGTQLLHYLYPNLYSANSTSTIGSTTFYELVNPQPNVFGPYASYRQPNPPNVNPTTHRYVELLLNTTGLPVDNESTLGLAGVGARTPFNAASVIAGAGVVVVGSNWFNVSNEAALANGSATTGTATSSGGATSTGAAVGTKTGTATGSGATASASGSAGELAYGVPSSSGVLALGMGLLYLFL